MERQPRRPPGRVRAPTPRRVAVAAREAVEQAQAAIATIHADGAPVKEHLDQLQHHATELRRRAEPIAGLDALDHNGIRQLDQALDAVDTYAGWLEGRPTRTARLAHAVGTLTAVGRSVPSFARHAGEVDQAQWYRLLDLTPPLHELERGRPTPEIELGR